MTNGLIDIEKLSRGAQRRLIQLESLKSSEKPVGNNDASSGSESLLLFISETIGNLSIADQLNLVKLILDDRDRHLYEIHAVGSIYMDAFLNVDLIRNFDDEFYSTIVESLFNSNCLAQHNLEHSEPVIRQFNHKVATSIRTLISFPKWNENSPSKFGFNGFEEVKSSIFEFRKLFFRVVGPDICIALQSNTDYSLTIPKEKLMKYYNVSKRFDLDDLYINSIIIKSMNYYNSERSFLSDLIFNNNFKFHSPVDKQALLYILGYGSRIPPKKSRSKLYSRNVIWLYYRLKSGIDDSNLYVVAEAVLDIYSFDKGLIPFLNWSDIADVIKDYNGDIDIKITFVTYLMTLEFVLKKFPDVYIANGMGALISDITSIVKQSRSKFPVIDLIKKIRTLQKRWPLAASELTRALLRRSMVERISSALLNIKTLHRKDLPHISPNRVSVVRFQLLNAADTYRLISKDEFASMMQKEMEVFKIDYFRIKMLGGRVGIAWSDFEDIIASVMDKEVTAFDAVSKGLGKTDDANRILFGLSRYVADKISDVFLYDSKAGIDQSLSNNLRHGIILPRFLRAFEDALQTTMGSKRGIISWDQTTLKKEFGDYYLYFVSYRDFVSEKIKDFVDNKLTIPTTGQFNLDFRRHISETIFKWAARRSYKNGIPKLKNAAKTVAIKQTQTFLRTASEQLGTHVKTDIGKEFAQVRSALKGNKAHNVQTFLDCLDTNIDTAFQEVSKWIHLSESKSESMPFKLSDSVALHLLSTSATGWQKLQVRTNCFVLGEGTSSKNDNHLFPGSQWEIFQAIVHNLLSNSFKYSGEGTKTKIILDVLVSPNKILFRCANSMSHRSRREAVQKYLHTVALAKSDLTDQARKDQSSGFQKMRTAVEKCFNVRPDFNIPLITPESVDYIVEVSIPILELNP